MLDVTRLGDKRTIWRRAHYILACLQHFYIHSLPPQPAKTSVIIPKPLAVPMVEVSKKIDLPPILTFADIVLWDSHPLALGSTPQQVWIDGIPQLTNPRTLTKSTAFQHLPNVPNFDKEAKETLKHDGLPPLEPKSSLKDTVIFANQFESAVTSAFAGRNVRRIIRLARMLKCQW